jgi:hypothetical protein
MDDTEIGWVVRELGISGSAQGPVAGYGEKGSESEGFYKQRGNSI